MSEITVNRRQAVRAAAGVAAGGVLVAGAGVGSASAATKGLLGSWLVEHHSTKDPKDKGTTVVSFIADGVLVSNDINPPGGVYTGSWSDRAGGRFRATFWAGAEAHDKMPATYTRVRVSGRRDGRKISGDYTVVVFRSSNNKVLATDRGKFSGVPLPD